MKSIIKQMQAAKIETCKAKRPSISWRDTKDSSGWYVDSSVDFPNGCCVYFYSQDYSGTSATNLHCVCKDKYHFCSMPGVVVKSRLSMLRLCVAFAKRIGAIKGRKPARVAVEKAGGNQ